LKLATIKNAVHLGCSGQFAALGNTCQILPEIVVVFQHQNTPGYGPGHTRYVVTLHMTVISEYFNSIHLLTLIS